MPDQPEMWSSLDSNSFRFCKHIASAAFYSQCITKMTSRLPQNVSGILFLSNTPPTGNRRQNIIPFGHWESAREYGKCGQSPCQGRIRNQFATFEKTIQQRTLQRKAFEKLSTFLIPAPVVMGLFKKRITEF